MEKYLTFDANLTKQDRLVLENLATDVRLHSNDHKVSQANGNGKLTIDEQSEEIRNESTLSSLNSLNDPKDPHFEPTVFANGNYDEIEWKTFFNRRVVRPYIGFAQSIVRVDTDVVMLTHILLYFTTSVPSALYLFFWNFNWVHGLLHFVMQASYMGAYTLLMHQHIHGRGVLKKQFALFDQLFPYITDPLMGHTWNSYYYHHVKHHHIEGNGPNDLSSTIRYQRDEILHFLHYVGKFFFFVWLELPMYFIRQRRYMLAARSGFWDIGNYTTLYLLYSWKPRESFCLFLLPLFVMRIALMAGNWAQHAFVDQEDPGSDYRSSITLVDVQSNRYSYNDGYHTSHHLNPLRHWRDHPNAFIKGKEVYSSNNALVFHNIDYMMITITLMRKDYYHLAKCMVPIGEEQLAMDLEDRVALLKKLTRKFSEQQIKEKYKLLA